MRRARFASRRFLRGGFTSRSPRPDAAALAADEDVAAGELTSVTYRMDTSRRSNERPALEFGATATIEAPPREVTKRSLSGEELLRVAGTRGDPLRAIEYMPGVGRSPQAEFIIIRGSSPADSEVEFEGAPVYRLYHFGGLTSFVQPRLLDKIDLYPGNFSARFGRKMGGIVDVGLRDPKTDGLHGMIDINIVDSSFLVEGPLTKNWSFAVAAKRSYIDLFIDKLVPKDQAQLTAAPVYWDYQAMLAYKPSGDDRFRAMVYGSYDDLKLILAHPADSDPVRARRPELKDRLSSRAAHLAAQVQRRRRARDRRLGGPVRLRRERRTRRQASRSRDTKPSCGRNGARRWSTSCDSSAVSTSPTTGSTSPSTVRRPLRSTAIPTPSARSPAGRPSRS